MFACKRKPLTVYLLNDFIQIVFGVYKAPEMWLYCTDRAWNGLPLFWGNFSKFMTTHQYPPDWLLVLDLFDCLSLKSINLSAQTSSFLIGLGVAELNVTWQFSHFHWLNESRWWSCNQVAMLCQVLGRSLAVCVSGRVLGKRDKKQNFPVKNGCRCQNYHSWGW